MASESAQQLVRKFYGLQEERAETYQLFEQGFKAYLDGAPIYNFPLYRQLVHEITETFKNTSTEIISIKKCLQDNYGLDKIAKYIETIQEEEEKKLELTAKLQMSRQNATDQPDNAAHNREVTNLKLRLRAVTEQICESMEDLKYDAEGVLLVNEDECQER